MVFASYRVLVLMPYGTGSNAVQLTNDAHYDLWGADYSRFAFVFIIVIYIVIIIVALLLVFYSLFKNSIKTVNLIIMEIWCISLKK